MDAFQFFGDDITGYILDFLYTMLNTSDVDEDEEDLHEDSSYRKAVREACGSA